MTDKAYFKSAILTIGTYIPNTGKENELLKLVKEHQPALREYGFLTDKPGFVAESQNGTIIEVFEWTGLAAVEGAKQHPVIAAIWQKMHAIGDTPLLKNLQEANEPFPGFNVLKLD